jgi:hypothetical protein
MKELRHLLARELKQLFGHRPIPSFAVKLVDDAHLRALFDDVAAIAEKRGAGTLDLQQIPSEEWVSMIMDFVRRFAYMSEDARVYDLGQGLEVYDVDVLDGILSELVSTLASAVVATARQAARLERLRDQAWPVGLSHPKLSERGEREAPVPLAMAWASRERLRSQEVTLPPRRRPFSQW